MEQFGYEQKLTRTFAFGDMVRYALVFMVLIAPFGIFGGVFQASGGQVALVYVVGVIAMMITASSYAVNAQAYPLAGSVFAYAGRAIAPWVGFLGGWVVLLDYFLVPGLLSLVAAASMTAVLPAVPKWAWIVVFIVINTGLNLRGIKTTRSLNKWFLRAQIAVLSVYVVAAVLALASGAGRGFSWEPFYTSGQFRIGVLAAGVSLAALSFLGFDALSTMAEDAKGGARQVGRAQVAALGITGAVFVMQTFLAALLVEDPAALIANGDPNGTAFYETARVAAGPWLATLTAVATALAWGIANNMVAQVATSRLLMAMARDKVLPGFLERVSVARSVPTNAVWLAAVISLALGLGMSLRADGGITLMASLVNFGALLSFVLVHLSVLARNFRKGQRRIAGFLRSWVLPLAGIAVLVAVIVNQNVFAQRLGFAWLAAGLVILIVLVVTGRTPRLPGIESADEIDHAVVVGHRA